MAMIDLTGRVFGRWSVIKLSHKDEKSALFWECLCSCGTRRPVFGGDLKRGSSVSCGCHRDELSVARSTTHNLARHPAYRSFIKMKVRCFNKKDGNYYLYGARGITVCERWENSFENFWEDMGPAWQPGLSVERDNVNGNYEPGNCRWATPKEQANNRRSNVIIETPKGRMNIQQAADTFGLTHQTISSRIRYGWDDYELTKPLGYRQTPK